MTSFANDTGCRKFGDATMKPNPIRDVASAAAPHVGTEPNHGRTTSGRQPRWANVHAWAKPYASAACHLGFASAQRYSGRIVIPALIAPLPGVDPTQRTAAVFIRTECLFMVNGGRPPAFNKQ